jgi:hypothetical protein
MQFPPPKPQKKKSHQFVMHLDDELSNILNELASIHSIPKAKIVRHLMIEQMPQWKKIIKAKQRELAREAVSEHA